MVSTDTLAARQRWALPAAETDWASSGGLDGVMGWVCAASWVVCAASLCQAETWAWVSVTRQEESNMNATTVAVDLAKKVFEVAVADRNWKVI